MSSSLTALSQQLRDVTAHAAARVVAVHARPRVTSSGILWSPGHVITADHTVAREKEIHLTLPDGSQVEGQLKGRDAATNLALITFNDSTARSPWVAAVPEAGGLLLAVGRDPMAGARAAFGILSTAGGSWRTWRGGQMERLLRLDLLLHPSVSGGAVVDAEGRLLGLATDGLSRTSPMAIPVAAIERIVPQLAEAGRVARPYLGVGLQPVASAQGRGLILLSVEPGGAADHAGLLVGDVVLEAAGRATAESEELQVELESRRPGDTLALRIVRGGEIIQVSVVLGERS
jgi:S1-C subfamily serine protease